MDDHAPHLHQFVRRVHRRLVLLRVAEAGGIGLLFGSGFAIALAGLLLWLGRPAAEAVAGCMLTGLALGCGAGFARRPGVLRAAITADGQLELADLLSTALSADKDDDPWVSVVVRAADARCATLSPSAVLLRRFDGRAWGAIALAAALAMTLAAFSAGSGAAQAGLAPDARPSVAAHLPPLPDAPTRAPLAGAPVERRRTWNDPEDTGRTLGGDMTSDDGGESADLPPPADSADPDRARPGASDATGGGAATANGKPNPDRTRRPPVRTTGAGSADAESPVAAGAGAASKGAGRIEGATGHAAGAAAAAAQPAPPWESESWSRDVQAARAAVGAGRVPDAYRDLVRDYFERP